MGGWLGLSEGLDGLAAAEWTVLLFEGAVLGRGDVGPAPPPVDSMSASFSFDRLPTGQFQASSMVSLRPTFFVLCTSPNTRAHMPRRS